MDEWIGVRNMGMYGTLKRLVGSLASTPSLVRTSK